MPLQIGGQVDSDQSLRAVDENLGEVFESGYDVATERVVLANITSIRNETRTEIQDAYAGFGGFDAVFAQKYNALNLAPAATPDERRAAALRVAQEMCGPFMFGTEQILESLGLAGNKALRTMLNEVLKDGFSAEADSLENRRYLRATLAKLVIIPPRERATFVREALGAVDFGELATAEAKVEPTKAKLKEATDASGFFRRGEHKQFASVLGKLRNALGTPLGLTDPSRAIDLDRPIQTQIEAADTIIENQRMLLSGRNAPTGTARTTAENALSDANLVKKQLGLVKFSEVKKELDKLMNNLKVCQNLKVSLGTGFPRTSLDAVLQEYENLGEDYSFNDLSRLFTNTPTGTNLSDVLENLKAERVSTNISKKSGPLRKQSGQQEYEANKLREKEHKMMNLSDEDFALAINKQILARTPETNGLSEGQREEIGREMILRDFTAMDNEAYFRRVAEGVAPQVVDQQRVTNRILTMSFNLTDSSDQTKGKTTLPLADVTAADLDPADQLALPRAVKAGRIDWKKAFVLMLSFEKLGETNSRRNKQLEDVARKGLAKEIGVQPYAPECEEAFQDQVAMLQTQLINPYFDSFDTNNNARVGRARNLVTIANAWVDEGLRTGEMTGDDYDDIVDELDNMGYFTSERLMDNGTVAVMPRDQALNALQAMFNRIPTEQKRRDRAKLVGGEAAEIGKKLGGKAVGLGLGLTKLVYVSTPITMLKYGVGTPLSVGWNLLTNPFHPIKGLAKAKEAFTTSVKADVKSGITDRWDALRQSRATAVAEKKTAFDQLVEHVKKSSGDLGDAEYKKRTENSLEKLKKRMEAQSKRVSKPALVLTEVPFIDPKKYKKAQAA